MGEEAEFAVDVYDNSDEEEEHKDVPRPLEESKNEPPRPKRRNSSSSDEEVVKWSLLGPVLKPGEKK